MKKQNSFLSRCAYGVADIYGGGAFVIIGTFFTVFLTKALGMPPALAGTIPLIGKVWDAITDPAMATQHGIAYIYIFVPVLLCLITMFFTLRFPMNKKEFEMIRKEVARRKGEDDSEITQEEIEVCEKVTGFAYDKLWNKDNALKMK